MTWDLDMNQLGILEGTDKSSSVSYSWDYLRAPLRIAFSC
jgi:hypothetical protein